jgi:hypothetical protein
MSIADGTSCVLCVAQFRVGDEKADWHDCQQQRDFKCHTRCLALKLKEERDELRLRLETANGRLAENRLEQVGRLLGDRLPAVLVEPPPPPTARARARELEQRFTAIQAKRLELATEENALRTQLEQAQREAHNEELEQEGVAWARALGLAMMEKLAWVKSGSIRPETLQRDSDQCTSEFTYVLNTGETLALSIRHPLGMRGRTRLEVLLSQALRK